MSEPELVARLRGAAAGRRKFGHAPTIPDLFDLAADEIERLRANGCHSRCEICGHMEGEP